MAGRRIDTLEYLRTDKLHQLIGFAAMPTPNELYDQASDLRDQGDKEEAVAKLLEAVAIDPAFALGHGMLAKLYADLASAEKAIEHAKKVVELEPDDAFSYTALSVVYQRCGRIPEAEHAKAMAYQKQMGFD
jgi:tetratricopeptide (TPR) repeat protein